MFQTGEFIVYGNIGVCKVTEITMPDFPNMYKNQLYYVLKPLYQNGTIYAPVNTAVFMRPIITRGKAKHLIAMIPSVQAAPYHNRNIQLLAEHYEMALKSHDCADLIELVMSIYAKRQYMEQQNRKFGQVDAIYMKRAEKLLFDELSAALGIPKDNVSAYIASRIDAANKERKKKHDECNS